MRRIKTNRSKKNRTHAAVGGARRSQPDYAKPEETDESAEKRDAARPGFGFMENDRARRSNPSQGRRDETSDTETDTKYRDSQNQPALDKQPQKKNQGRPDQLSEGSEEEDEIETQEPVRGEQISGEEREIEGDDIEEGDDESRGGMPRPDQEDEEEMRRRRKGHGRDQEPRTNMPE